MKSTLNSSRRSDRAASSAGRPRPRQCPGGTAWHGDIRARAVLIVVAGDDKVIGPRFIRLLEEIDARGSVRAAASTLGLGYRHAIAWLRRAERVLGRPLAERHAGGTAGGGAGLTPDARHLIAAYHRVTRRLARVVASAEREILA